MIRYVFWIRTELQDPLIFDGIRYIEVFMEDLNPSGPKRASSIIIICDVEIHTIWMMGYPYT
jgi:hypothetical protein